MLANSEANRKMVSATSDLAGLAFLLVVAEAPCEDWGPIIDGDVRRLAAVPAAVAAQRLRLQLGLLSQRA